MKSPLSTDKYKKLNIKSTERFEFYPDVTILIKYL